MSFVKLDCGILDSSLWFDTPARDIFITALLMAVPYETTEPMPQFEVMTLNKTGWDVPPGWYGFVKAAGMGICHRASVDADDGPQALMRLGSPDSESRSCEFEGRRLVRVNGGYIVLNYFRYRDRDVTAAERMRRYRASKATPPVTEPLQPFGVTERHVTHADADADAEEEKKDACASRAPAMKFRKPSRDEVSAYIAQKAYDRVNADAFIAFYESNGWRVGRNPMKDWRSAVVTWQHRDNGKPKARKGWVT